MPKILFNGTEYGSGFNLVSNVSSVSRLSDNNLYVTPRLKSVVDVDDNFLAYIKGDDGKPRKINFGAPLINGKSTNVVEETLGLKVNLTLDSDSGFKFNDTTNNIALDFQDDFTEPSNTKPVSSVGIKNYANQRCDQLYANVEENFVHSKEEDNVEASLNFTASPVFNCTTTFNDKLTINGELELNASDLSLITSRGLLKLNGDQLVGVEGLKTYYLRLDGDGENLTGTINCNLASSNFFQNVNNSSKIALLGSIDKDSGSYLELSGAGDTDYNGSWRLRTSSALSKEAKTTGDYIETTLYTEGENLKFSTTKYDYATKTYSYNDFNLTHKMTEVKACEVYGSTYGTYLCNALRSLFSQIESGKLSVSEPMMTIRNINIPLESTSSCDFRSVRIKDLTVVFQPYIHSGVNLDYLVASGVGRCAIDIIYEDEEEATPWAGIMANAIVNFHVDNKIYLKFDFLGITIPNAPSVNHLHAYWEDIFTCDLITAEPSSERAFSIPDNSIYVNWL